MDENKLRNIINETVYACDCYKALKKGNDGSSLINFANEIYNIIKQKDVYKEFVDGQSEEITQEDIDNLILSNDNKIKKNDNTDEDDENFNLIKIVDNKVCL